MLSTLAPALLWMGSCLAAGEGGAGDSPWLLSSPSLPAAEDSKYLATLANGQLAVTPGLRTSLATQQFPAIFVNCLYNGRGWNTHRARLPNYSNYVLEFSRPAAAALYSLDLYRGKFVASHQLAGLAVRHELLVHRDPALAGLILNLVTAEAAHAQTGEAAVEVSLGLDTGGPSLDITSTGVASLEVPANTLGLTSLLYRCRDLGTSLIRVFSGSQVLTTPQVRAHPLRGGRAVPGGPQPGVRGLDRPRGREADRHRQRRGAPAAAAPHYSGRHQGRWSVDSVDNILCR